MKRIITILAGIAVTCAMSVSVFAQGGYQVKGVVVDEAGPVVGATVLEAGTSNGTSTGLDGEYVLSVKGADALVEVSCIGYATQTFRADAVPSVVKLAEDNEFLDEAVAIGYGSLSKKELSSSIVQVDKKDFFRGSMNNAMEMLTGKVAGLNVNTTAAANPNSNSSLQVRGATSLTAGNDPLIVIDGVPGGEIRNIAPQDIESMTVLKDAASAAIYGTRGANGVILITTKKGSEGEPGTSHITYDSYFGVNIAKPHPEVLSADEFRRSRRGTDYGYDTDWYSELLNDFSYEHNQYIAIDGSTKGGSYNASVNYKKAEGLDLVDDREEYGIRAAIEQKALKNILTFNVSLNARKVNETWGDDGQFSNALSINPTIPIYNEDGTYYQPTSPTNATNPVSAVTLKTNDGHRTYLLGTAGVKAALFTNEHHNLTTSLTYSVNYNDLKSNYYTPSTSSASYWGGYAGDANISYNKYTTNNLEWLFNYTFSSQDHTVQAVAGYSYEDYVSETMYMDNKDFAYDNFLYNNIGSGSYLGEGLASMSSGKTESKLIGVFTRVNYNWKDLIMASASIRYEGSTKFGANKKWGSFPAASVAWEIANMDFMDGTDLFQSLKPRVSYGVTGRSDFSAYKSLTTYSTYGNYYMDGEWVKGYAPSANANPDLGWEKLVSANIGVDVVMLGSRLRGSIDLFERQSQDLLYNYTAPQPPFVYNSILVNVGTTSNKGIELSVDGDIIAGKDWGWTSGVNWSYGTTKLTKLSNSVYNASYIDLYQKSGVGTNEYYFRVMEGGKVGQFYGYKTAGVNEEGTLLIYNDQDEVIPVTQADAAYKRYIGNGAPKHFLSWNNTIRYKSFDLNLFFTGAFGFDIFNQRLYNMGLSGSGSDNVLKTAYTKYDYISYAGGVISDFFLERGDYFKLQSATLGYNFRPQSREWIDSLRVYFTAKNVFTLTGYSGNDPSIVSVNGITPSVDVASAYPTALQLTLGVTLTF